MEIQYHHSPQVPLGGSRAVVKNILLNRKVIIQNPSSSSQWTLLWSLQQRRFTGRGDRGGRWQQQQKGRWRWKRSIAVLYRQLMINALILHVDSNYWWEIRPVAVGIHTFGCIELSPSCHHSHLQLCLNLCFLGNRDPSGCHHCKIRSSQEWLYDSLTTDV